jgi:hypothetical protein
MTTPDSPSRDDGVTMACLLCARPFITVGRRRFCSDACQAAAWRRRHAPPVVAVPAATGRSMTVYACDACGDRAVGEQRWDECSTFMRRLGLGGACPSCDEPVTIAELIGQEVGL